MAKIATREAYGKALSKIVCESDNIIVLDADLSKSTKTADAKAVCPERHINMGIAEGNMMAVAAGLASSGNVVFASTFAMFAAGRAFEQIRNSIGYPHMNVKVCATHAGITVGEDGASHQSFEDLALMRTIPGMTVICPSDAVETEQVIEQIAKIDGPFYIRLGRSGVEVFNDPASFKFEIGKATTLRKGSKIAVIATGIMVAQALEAYETLKQDQIEITVVNMATIKPIDKQAIIDIASTHDVIITAEEHSIIGGLGSAVAEITSEYHPCKIVRIGQLDIFGESGKPDQLLEKYHMDAKTIVSKVKENI